ncbi:MAG: hypothetical protein BIFFINMI_02634 [Phycisphaerae bacterium]|nr:hypothetical protein [Phycisphaerae bacterium]
MKRNLWWRLALIGALTLIFLAKLVPWGQLDNGFQWSDMLDVLRPGIDLNGGTKLLYEVNTENWSGSQSETPAQTMISALKERIDPQGLLNLQWTPVGPDRIEITIPRATESAVQQRSAYDQAEDQLQATQITPADISEAEREAGLATDEAGVTAAFMKLGKGIATRDEMLKKTGEAYAAFLKADRDEKAATTQPADATPSSQPAAAPVVTHSEAYMQAKTDYAKLLQQLQEKNINLSIVREVLAKGKKERGKAAEGSKESPWQALLSQNKGYESILESVRDKYDAWKERKASLDDPNDIKRLLQGTGRLEFFIAARRAPGFDPGPFVKALNEQIVHDNQVIVGDYRWAMVGDPSIVTRGQEVTAQRAGTGTWYVLLHNTDDKRIIHLSSAELKKKGEPDWKFKSAYVTSDELGRPAVGFEFDGVGGDKFGKLTAANLKEPLSAVMDGTVISVATIQSQINTRGIISGSFSNQEVAELARKMQAGALPGSLSREPISESTVSATLGEAHRRAGLFSVTLGLIAVAVFMLVYYLVPLGLVADIALLLNLIFILGAMAMSNSTFTLAGIAGVILTVGMAVDANVLIDERIREEQERGAPMRVALKNGYNKALSTILDANITTLITTIILYMVGTSEIKSFAVVLGIGIVSSVFTALFVTRVLLQLGVEYRLIKRHFPMLKLIGHTNIRWMNKRFIFWTISGVLLVAGLSEFGYKMEKDASHLFDIEFLGGTKAQVTLRPGVKISDGDFEAAARAYSSSSDWSLRDVSVSRVLEEGGAAAAHGPTFEVKSTTQDPAKFQSDLLQLLESPNNVNGLGAESLLPRRVQVTWKFEKQWAELQGTELSCPNAFIIDKDYETSRTDIGSINLSTWRGGVGVVIEGLSPARSVEDIKDRISRKLGSLDPKVQSLPRTGWNVIGVDRAAETAASGAATYTKVLYVSRQPAEAVSSIASGGDANWWKNFGVPEVQMIASALTSVEPLDSISSFDTAVARDVQWKALVAIVMAMLAIVVYVWVRFGNWLFGLGAVIPLIHDVAITIGLVALSRYLSGTAIGRALLITDFRFDMTVVAAVLTIIGYSLNDTIVVFDRIRENRGRLSYVTPKIIDDSINQTLSRTLLTSLTTILAVFIMYVFGGPGIHAFTFALLVGLIVGTYSSIAVASPIVMGWRQAILRKAVDQQQGQKAQTQEA